MSISYSDTDSIYIHAEPLLRHLYSNFDEMSSFFDEVIHILRKLIIILGENNEKDGVQTQTKISPTGKLFMAIWLLFINV